MFNYKRCLYFNMIGFPLTNILRHNKQIKLVNDNLLKLLLVLGNNSY